MIDEGGDDAAGLSFAGADDGGSMTARKFAAIEQGLEHGAGPRRQLVAPDFLFGPEQDARAQLVGLHQPFHERDLIHADGEEEPGEFRQILFAQVSSAVEIIAARQVAGGEVSLVGIDIAREAARDRPDRAGVEGIEERGVRDEARDAAITIEERVNPREAMMRGRR